MDRDLEELVWSRAVSVCEYCQMPQRFDDLPFEIDHVLATSHGGKTVAGNLALACFPCNRFKGPNLAGLDPKTSRLAKLFHPRRHAWPRHFCWEGAILLGLTPIGRTTIRVLHINDLLRVRLRTQLVSEGALQLDIE